LAPLITKFNSKFFSSGTENKGFPIKNDILSYKDFIKKNNVFSLEKDMCDNSLKIMFNKKLNSYNSLSGIREWFPNIVKKILMMNSEFIEKMITDDNFFAAQVNTIINSNLLKEKSKPCTTNEA